jgi:regulator of protease activity HflC (stomatin/prohibitin superfamily)
MTTEPTDPLGQGPGEEANSAPRRAASARFEVGASGQDSLREAFDPATHSLGDALKLSYRILQLGIVVLAISFLFSGFKSVNEGDTGVRTLFGAIAGKGGEEQLQPGFQPFWPYPIGELIVFPESSKGLSMSLDFWPASRAQGDARQKTLQEQIDSASVDAGLRPGSVGNGDGSLLTKDGDIGHCRLEISYEIFDAVKYLSALNPAATDDVVKAAVRQGTVEAASTLTLAEFTDTRDLLGPAIAERAQRTLDRLAVGIRLTSVAATERMAPLAVQNRYRDVQTGRENAKAAVERARQEAVKTLTQVAGGEVYVELLKKIREYEELLGAGRDAEAEAKLVDLGKRMEAPDVGGEVSQTIARAKASESSLRAGLERDLRRLESLAPTFRESGGQIVRQLWIGAVRDVLEDPLAEVYASPDAIGLTALRLTSSGDIMQARRNAEIARKKAEQAARDAGIFFAPNAEQIAIDKAGRLLKKDASGGLGKN